MTAYFFDGTTPLPSDSESALYLTDSGTAFIGQSITNRTGKAVKADSTQNILVAANMMINGGTVAFDFHGSGSSLNNQGNIYSLEGTGVLFSGGGTNNVTNQGTIVAKDGIKIGGTESTANKLHLINSGSIIASNVAVTGGIGDDYVVNTKTLSTTGDVLVDLGKGNDYYDNSSGSAFGKIVLGEGNDTAIGGTGSDIFSGGAGDDYLDGGAGIDTADYSDDTDGIEVDLKKTTVQTISDKQGRDVLINIENVTGGSGADIITGNNGDNVLNGGAGDDVLDGGLGNDVLDGGAGGNDTIRFGSGSASVVLNLSNLERQNTSGYGWDIVRNVEHVEGANGADDITGNEADNKLTGNFGNDKLSGGKGSDTLDGGYGDDTLEGGEGNDTLIGGPGNDMAVFSGLKSDYIIDGIPSTGTVTEDTELTVEHKEGGINGKDSLKGIRLLKFLGNPDTTDDDVIIGFGNHTPTSVSLTDTSGVKENSDTDTLVGKLSGVDPDGDELTYELLDTAGGLFKLGSDGRSIYIAKDGVLDYEAHSFYTLKVKVKDGITSMDGTSNGTLETTVTIKVINEAEAISVVRYGTNASETLSGELGSDIIKGFGGSDTINGDDGDDRIYGGTGNDTLIGGAGRDKFYFDTVLSSSSNVDSIRDFNPTDDTIYLSRTIFKGVVTKAGYMKGSAFKIGNSFDKTDRFVYEPNSGGLYYDRDGSGKKYNYVQVADLASNLKLTYKDFYFF